MENGKQTANAITLNDGYHAYYLHLYCTSGGTAGLYTYNGGKFVIKMYGANF